MWALQGGFRAWQSPYLPQPDTEGKSYALTGGEALTNLGSALHVSSAQRFFRTDVFVLENMHATVFNVLVGDSRDRRSGRDAADEELVGKARNLLSDQPPVEQGGVLPRYTDQLDKLSQRSASVRGQLEGSTNRPSASAQRPEHLRPDRPSAGRAIDNQGRIPT